MMSSEPTRFGRLETSTPELDMAELAWWQRFSEVEDRFCWVQTPDIQRLLRGHYLRRIAQLSLPDRTIAEIGCGTGWLSVLLAGMGASHVVGFDFSEAQIEKARQRAIDSGVQDRVEFHTANASELSQSHLLFDVIVLHGFLHHLATSEIEQVIRTVDAMLTRNGLLIVVEPVRYPSLQPSPAAKRMLRRLEWLRSLPMHGHRLGRQYSPQEITFREIISHRSVGEPPRGPSPKEMPFEEDELPALLKSCFVVKSRLRCMTLSHLVAQELLLMQLSHPTAGRLMRLPLLITARNLERRLLRLEPVPPDIWVFEMFECARAEYDDKGKELV